MFQLECQNFVTRGVTTLNKGFYLDKLTFNPLGNRQNYRITHFPTTSTGLVEVDGDLNEYIFENLDGSTDYIFIVRKP